jgi:hypothetical protein
MPIGRTYRSEVQALLRNVRKTAEPAAAPQKKGMFGRG